MNRFEIGDIVRRSKKWADRHNRDFKDEGCIKEVRGGDAYRIEFTNHSINLNSSVLRLVRRPE